MLTWLVPLWVGFGFQRSEAIQKTLKAIIVGGRGGTLGVDMFGTRKLKI